MAEHRFSDPKEQLRALKRALQVIQDGRKIDADVFADLVRGGYVGGTRALPAITARGEALLAAHVKHTSSARVEKPSIGDLADGSVVVPDIVSRLARPRKGEACLLEPCDVAAAERLQRDLDRAQITARIGQNWSLGAMTSGSNRASRGSFHEDVGNLDARERVRKALDAVGPEFSGLLLDICLFEKSLTVIETERRWPARSGKLAVALGLKSLARHYGLDQEARGPR